jgi:hypothetical protein
MNAGPSVHVIPVHLQIVLIVRPVHMVTVQSVAMIVVHRVIVQPVVHTEIATHVRALVRLLIEESAVTVRAIHAQVLIAHPVHTVIDQIVVMIAVHRVIVQLVAHTVTEIHVQVPIVHVAKIHTVAIVHAQAMIDVPQVAPTVLVMSDHHVMIAAVRVTVNAVVVQIVPEVVSPMIAKSVHAVALAKSA